MRDRPQLHADLQPQGMLGTTIAESKEKRRQVNHLRQKRRQVNHLNICKLYNTSRTSCCLPFGVSVKPPAASSPPVQSKNTGRLRLLSKYQ